MLSRQYNVIGMGEAGGSVSVSLRLYCHPVAACRYGSKTSGGTGKGITVYVVDSGIRTTHQEFISATTGQKRATFGCAPAFISLPVLTVLTCYVKSLAVFVVA